MKYQKKNLITLLVRTGLSIGACVFSLCCCCIPGLCALPAVILAIIAKFGGPATTAERKNSFARVRSRN